MGEAVKLVSRQGTTSVHIDVRIDENGSLLFSGHDLGEAPDEVFGDFDYEYFLSIPATEKDRVLLALIEKLYRGNESVVSEFREFMESNGIPCMFHSF